jgi:hypothetical protein
MMKSEEVVEMSIEKSLAINWFCCASYHSSGMEFFYHCASSIQICSASYILIVAL